MLAICVEVYDRTKGTISTLHEALELCKELNLSVILDVKTWFRVIKVHNQIV